MSLVRQIKRLVRRMFDAFAADVHTSLPAQVVSYDPDTNTCSIQPCILRARVDDSNNTELIAMQQVDDVPVKQQGSGKLLLSVAPQVGSYGMMVVQQRNIENWLQEGGTAAPASSKMFHFSDAIFDPGLYPLVVDGDNGKLQSSITTDRISLRTRDGGGECSVLDDGTVYTNGVETILQDGSDYAVQFTALKDAFDQLKSDFDSLVSTYNAHIHITTATVGIGPPGVIAATTSQGSPSTADMSGAKIDDVRLP